MTQIMIPIYRIGDAFQLKINMNVLLTNYINLAVWIVHEDNTVLEKYSLNAMTDHNTDDVATVDTTTFRIYGQPEVTVNAKEGIYRAVIFANKTNANYDEGLVRQRDQRIFKMKKIETTVLI